MRLESLLRLFGAMLLPAAPAAAGTDVYLACTFETLPQIVMHYPNQQGEKPTMSVGLRPPVEMTVGAGTGRLETANVDGFIFQFSPSNMRLDVRRAAKQVASERARCARIGGPENTDPLEIAAAQAQVAPDATSHPAQPSGGSWVIHETTSALDDSPLVSLVQTASSRVTDRFDNGDFPNLILRCKENTTSVYMMVGGLFLADIQGYGRVDYRLDDDPRQQKSMAVSTDNQALGLWRGRTAIPFIRAMFGKSRMLVRVTPYNESPVEFEFDISGLEQAITPLRKACHW